MSIRHGAEAEHRQMTRMLCMKMGKTALRNQRDGFDWAPLRRAAWLYHPNAAPGYRRVCEILLQEGVDPWERSGPDKQLAHVSPMVDPVIKALVAPWYWRWGQHHRQQAAETA